MRRLLYTCLSLIFLLTLIFLSPIHVMADGTWTTVGSMVGTRAGGSSVVLPNGKVLVAGGSNGLSSGNSLVPYSEIYDPSTQLWTQSGNLNTPRAIGRYDLVLLNTGKVLVAGGNDINGSPFNSAELYNPSAGTWSYTGNMNQARRAAVTVLLSDGRVLVAGGAGTENSAEIYDPSAGTWSSVASMPYPSTGGHSLTLLQNGKVLLAGGHNLDGYPSAAAIYDPNTDTWTSTPAMSENRGFHTAALLSDGRVIIVGGSGGSGTLSTTEIYDPVANTWSAGPSMSTARTGHVMPILPDHTLLAAGGVSDSTALSSAEIFSLGPAPTPSPDTISLSLSTASVTVGQPFSTTIVVHGGQAFNAAKATVTVSSNLTVNGIQSAPSPECNMNYTQSPSSSNPSFAGAIYGSSSTNCNVYTVTLTPNAVGTGTITFTNAQIKAYADNTNILSGVQNGSFTINSAPTPTGTATQIIDDSVQGPSQNQWNYNGSAWGHCTSCNETNPTVTFYNASQSWDNVANDYVTISFTGVQFKLYGATDPRDGIGAVSIDGGAETNVDFYSPTRTGNVLLWTSPILSNSTHTLKLRVTGTHDGNATDNYIILDRGDILSQAMPNNLSINTYPTDTYNSIVTLTGTKDASITTVYINGDNSNVTYPTDTTWQATVSLPSLGSNAFVIYGKDNNNTQTASINIAIDKHTLGDINGDGVVDLTDASLFAVDYGKTSNLTYPLSDMNGDGNVDLTDLSILAKLLPQ